MEHISTGIFIVVEEEYAKGKKQVCFNIGPYRSGSMLVARTIAEANKRQTA